MTPTPRVAAVVPVIEEEESIGDVVAELQTYGACCVYVIDGGSRDRTVDIAQDAGGIVIVEPERGYGRACRTGTEHAIAPAPDGHAHDAVAFLDGDGSCDPRDLPGLMTALEGADVALGSRPAHLLESGAMPWHARLGNLLVSGIVSLRTGRTVHDLPPYKVVRRETLERLALDDDRYGWTTQLVARALVEPMVRIRETPVRFRNRRGGVSKVSGSWRASLNAGRSMLSVAIEETRPRPVVALMAKAPRTGHAKTRLAVTIGEERTAKFWAACLEDAGANLRQAAVGGRLTTIVMLPHKEDVDPVHRIIGPQWIPIVQCRPGLSAALSEVFLAAFDRGVSQALAVAGDSPSLPPDQILAALARLATKGSSAVIGPSSDGGYHLVGLRWRAVPRWWPGRIRSRFRARLARRLQVAFDDVPLGSGGALEATQRALSAAGWRVERTGSWPDVDTLEDLQALARELEADRRRAPRTAAWIERNRSVINAGGLRGCRVGSADAASSDAPMAAPS